MVAMNGRQRRRLLVSHLLGFLFAGIGASHAYTGLRHRHAADRTQQDRLVISEKLPVDAAIISKPERILRAVSGRSGDIAEVFQTKSVGHNTAHATRSNVVGPTAREGPIREKPHEHEAHDYPEYPSAAKKELEANREDSDRLVRPDDNHHAYEDLTQQSKEAQGTNTEATTVAGVHRANDDSDNNVATAHRDSLTDVSDAQLKHGFDQAQYHSHNHVAPNSSQLAQAGYASRSYEAALASATTAGTSSAGESNHEADESTTSTTKFITRTHQPLSVTLPSIFRNVFTSSVKLKAHGPQHLAPHAQTIFDTIKPIMTEYWKAQIGSALKAYDLKLVYEFETTNDAESADTVDIDESKRVVTNFAISVVLDVVSHSMNTLVLPNHDSATEDLALFFRGQSLLELLTTLREAGVHINELVYQHEEFHTPEATDTPTAAPTGQGPAVSKAIDDGSGRGTSTTVNSPDGGGNSRLGLFAGIGAGCLVLGAIAFANSQNKARRLRAIRERLSDSSGSESGDGFSDEQSFSGPPSEVMTMTNSVFDLDNESSIMVQDPRVAATYQKYPSLGIRPAAIQKKPAFSKDYLKTGLEAPSIESPGTGTQSERASIVVGGDYGIGREYDVITKSPVSDYSSFQQLRAAEEEEFSMPEEYGSVSTSQPPRSQPSMSMNHAVRMQRTGITRSGRSMLLEQGLATPSTCVGKSSLSTSSPPESAYTSPSSSPSVPVAYSPFGPLKNGAQTGKGRGQEQTASTSSPTKPQKQQPHHVRKTSSYDDTVSASSPQMAGRYFVPSPQSHSTHRPHGVPVPEGANSPNTIYSMSVRGSPTFSVRMMDGPDMLASSAGSVGWGRSVNAEQEQYFDEWSVASFRTSSPKQTAPEKKQPPQRTIKRGKDKKKKDKKKKKKIKDGEPKAKGGDDYNDASPADLDMPPLV